MRRRLAAALLAVAAGALASCKRDAQPPATPAPATSATPPPVTAAAASDAVSFFEPANGACEWVRLELATKGRTVLATVPGSCDGARVAWSADRTRALVWTESGDPPRTSLHEIQRGVATARPAPPVGALRDAGFDSGGRLLALTLEEIPASHAKKGFTVADGEKLTVPAGMDGLPAIARAFAWESGAWKRIETKVTDDAWDLAIGVAALDAEDSIGVRSWRLLSSSPEGREANDVEAKALDAGCPRKIADEGSWFRLERTSSPAAFVRLEEADFVFTLPPVCLLAEGKAAALALDLDPEDSISVQLSGAWMLVADSGGHRPHLVDLSTRKTAWSSRTATEAVFWP